MNENLKDHNIITAKSKSWYIGKPGTALNSYHITWSPGLLVIYGQAENVTLIDRNVFKTFRETHQWISSCTIDSFKSKINLYDDASVNDYFDLIKFWNSQSHYS